MQNQDQPVYDLIVEIRTAFNTLKAVSDAMIEDLGVTAAMRAVLEYIDLHGAQTVPQIAKAKSVTRQHIQVLADALAARGFVEFTENPGHKRSKLLGLTTPGQALFAEIRIRESAGLARIAKAIDPARARVAAEVLRELRHQLSGL